MYNFPDTLKKFHTTKMLAKKKQKHRGVIPQGFQRSLLYKRCTTNSRRYMYMINFLPQRRNKEHLTLRLYIAPVIDQEPFFIFIFWATISLVFKSRNMLWTCATKDSTMIHSIIPNKPLLSLYWHIVSRCLIFCLLVVIKCFPMGKSLICFSFKPRSSSIELIPQFAEEYFCHPLSQRLTRLIFQDDSVVLKHSSSSTS